MANAAGMLASPHFSPYGRDKWKADRLREFGDGMNDFQRATVTPLWAGISGIETGPDGRLRYAGDVMQFAQQSKEPMWQTESLLKLGRIRYMTEARTGDQRGADRILKQLAERHDLPSNVRTAARAGRDLDLMTFRMHGGA